MKKYIVAIVVSILISMSQVSYAAILTWDRNVEVDMKDYATYACFVKGCTVTQSATTLQPGFTVQSAVGVRPSYVIDIAGKEGSVAVSARDTFNNESGLSVQIPFDAKAPGNPVGLTF